MEVWFGDDLEMFLKIIPEMIPFCTSSKFNTKSKSGGFDQNGGFGTTWLTWIWLRPLK